MNGHEWTLLRFIKEFPHGQFSPDDPWKFQLFFNERRADVGQGDHPITVMTKPQLVLRLVSPDWLKNGGFYRSKN